MKFSDYTKILEVNAVLVEYNGEKHYINGKMNADVYDVMKNQEMTAQDKTVRLLACVICDESGVRIFDANNDDHINIVRSFPMGLQTTLIMTAQSKFFPDKKKELEGQH